MIELSWYEKLRLGQGQQRKNNLSDAENIYISKISKDIENQKQEKISLSEGSVVAKTNISFKTFFWEAVLFYSTIILGIATASRVSSIFEVQQIEIPQVSFWRFIISFIGATLIIFILVRLLKFRKEKKTIFKAIFIFSVFLGGVVTLESWLYEPASLILISSLIFWWLKKPKVINQDILIVLGLAGVGSTLGLSLKPEIIAPLLIIFSIYDYVAVYKTKHMVEMAKSMIESRAILGLVIPQDLSGFKEGLSNVEPGGRFMVLGGGDVVFPLLFSVSLLSSGIFDSLIVSLFSLMGLFATFLIFIKQKSRQPIPALPPIAFFSIIGYLITRLF